MEANWREQENTIIRLSKKDFVILIFLSVSVWFVAASSLGFLSAGFGSIYSYAGNDDMATISQVKELLQENWVWSTNRLGAPYGHEALAYPSICLQILEFLMFKFWGIFTKNVPTVINLQFVFTFVLCAIIAYLVLRKMKVGYFLSTGGAVLYAFSPYIYGRNIAHYCLAACYFVPLVIYLCYCCYFDSTFFKFNKAFFCKRNLLIMLMCFCISVNGISYYPFFACFYLSITALCKFFKTKRFHDTFPAIKMIVLICTFVVVALMPAIAFKIINGSESIATRTLDDIETYSLKITQLFGPNYVQYLGAIACIGFLIGILINFGIKKENCEDESVILLSRLNLAAVLVMSVGGFISILTSLFGIYSLRAFNRISIFIMFCSIAIVCTLVQKYVFEKNIFHIRPKWKNLLYVFTIIVVFVGIWEQTPQLYNNGANLNVNKKLWNNDAAFVSKIEEQLKAGDMVYQLPYHKYPEAGSVHEMNDYQLLVGYIHSETLKWSYGAYKESAGDKWNEYVSRLDIATMIDIIIASGFRGIYIESRAYTHDEMQVLLANIEEKLDYKPMISEDGNLYFYNLYPYIDKHPELLKQTELNIDYLPYIKETGIVFSQVGYNADAYVKNGINSPEESFSWTQGNILSIQFSFEDAANSEIVGVIECIDVFNQNQNVEISVNGERTYFGEVNSAQEILFTGRVGNDGRVEIIISLPDCISPLELGQSDDSRELALAIKSIKFYVNS